MLPSTKFLLLTFALAQASHAATYTWLDANSIAGGTNGWQFKGNYAEYAAPDNTGSFAFTAADEIVVGSTTRNVSANSAGTFGKVTFTDNGGTVGWASAAVVNLSGGSIANAGIEVRAGAGASRVNAPLILSGDLVFSNKSTGLFSVGVADGNGGLSGSGTLSVVDGRFVFRKTTGGYSYSGAVTVSNGGILQIANGNNFTSPIQLNISTGGTLAGRGTLGLTTIGAGATLNPGDEFDQNWGVLTFSSALTLQTGALTNLGFTSSGAFDRIAANGGIVYGGELRLTLVSGLTNPGTYQLFTGTKSGAFESVTLWNGTTALGEFTPDGLGVWQKTDGDSSYRFDAQSGELTVIPESGSTLLVLAGVTILTLGRQRRNA